MSRPPIDMTGKTFGKWTVLYKDVPKITSITKWICQCECGTISSVYGSSLRAGQSKQCNNCKLVTLHNDNKHRFQGENNPFYGKTHSEQTKLLMSQNHADFSGENNPFLKKYLNSPSLQKETSDRRKRWFKTATPEQLKSRSENLSKAMANSEFHKNFTSIKTHKSGYTTFLKTNRKLFYRSSWELKIINYLNQMDIVADIKYEPRVMQYYDGEKKRYTKPDLIILFDNKKAVIIEIKPKSLLKYDQNPNKIKAYRDFCKKYKIHFRLITNKFVENFHLFENLMMWIYKNG